MKVRDLSESLDQPLEWRWKNKSAGYSVAEFSVGEHTYWVHLAGQFTISIQFDLVGVGQRVTGTGSAHKVFATVLDIIKTFIGVRNPEAFSFGAKRSHPSRVKLYRALSNRLEPIAASEGYHLEIDEEDSKEVSFTFQKSE